MAAASHLLLLVTFAFDGQVLHRFRPLMGPPIAVLEPVDVYVLAKGLVQPAQALERKVCVYKAGSDSIARLRSNQSLSLPGQVGHSHVRDGRTVSGPRGLPSRTRSGADPNASFAGTGVLAEVSHLEGRGPVVLRTTRVQRRYSSLAPEDVVHA